MPDRPDYTAELDAELIRHTARVREIYRGREDQVWDDCEYKHGVGKFAPDNPPVVSPKPADPPVDDSSGVEGFDVNDLPVIGPDRADDDLDHCIIDGFAGQHAARISKGRKWKNVWVHNYGYVPSTKTPGEYWAGAGVLLDDHVEGFEWDGGGTLPPAYVGAAHPKRCQALFGRWNKGVRLSRLVLRGIPRVGIHSQYIYAKEWEDFTIDRIDGEGAHFVVKLSSDKPGGCDDGDVSNITAYGSGGAVNFSSTNHSAPKRGWHTDTRITGVAAENMGGEYPNDPNQAWVLWLPGGDESCSVDRIVAGPTANIWQKGRKIVDDPGPVSVGEVLDLGWGDGSKPSLWADRQAASDKAARHGWHVGLLPEVLR